MEPITRKERILSGEDIKPITRLEHFLKEAAGGGGGGSSSLPSYTDADKGKVLGLADNGESVAPAWVNGGGLPIIECKLAGGFPPSYIVKTAYADVLAAYNSGSAALLKLSEEGTDRGQYILLSPSVDITEYNGSYISFGFDNASNITEAYADWYVIEIDTQDETLIYHQYSTTLSILE